MKISPLLLCASLLCASPAFACSPVIHEVAEYAQGRIPDQAVFVGKVRSVEEQRYDGGVTQKARIEVTTWLSGQPHGTIVELRGSKTDPGSGIPCAGVFDFYVQAGQQWLFFGQWYQGALNPDGALSRLAPDGRVDAKVLAEFKRDARPAPAKAPK